MKIHGRVLGLDLGRKRVGVALSDETATIASPLSTILIKDKRDLAGKINAVMESVSLLGFLAPVVFLMMALLPYCVGWALFSFIYLFMPNTKVNLRSGRCRLSYVR